MEKTNHEIVQERITSEDAREAEILAAKILVHRNPFSQAYITYNQLEAKEKKQIAQATDNGDILFFKEGSKKYQRIEVKRLSSGNHYAYFSDQKEFVNGFIVDGVEQYNKKQPEPTLYMCFNAPLTYVAIIYTKDKKNWKITETNGNGGLKKYYVSKSVDIKIYEVNKLW